MLSVKIELSESATEQLTCCGLFGFKLAFTVILVDVLVPALTPLIVQAYELTVKAPRLLVAAVTVVVLLPEQIIWLFPKLTLGFELWANENCIQIKENSPKRNFKRRFEIMFLCVCGASNFVSIIYLLLQS
jgi:hypothetical protein